MHKKQKYVQKYVEVAHPVAVEEAVSAAGGGRAPDRRERAGAGGLGDRATRRHDAAPPALQLVQRLPRQRRSLLDALAYHDVLRTYKNTLFNGFKKKRSFRFKIEPDNNSKIQKKSEK